jgi:hypothetical protein
VAGPLRLCGLMLIESSRMRGGATTPQVKFRVCFAICASLIPPCCWMWKFPGMQVTEQAEAEAVLAFASLFRRRTLMNAGASVEPPPPSVSVMDTEMHAAPVATQSVDMVESAAAEDTKIPIMILSPVRGSENTSTTSQHALECTDSLSPWGAAASRGPSAGWPLPTPAEVRATPRNGNCALNRRQRRDGCRRTTEVGVTSRCGACVCGVAGASSGQRARVAY